MKRGFLLVVATTAAVWMWSLAPSGATSPPVESAASPLPGAGTFPEELATGLRSALDAKGSNYEPRTEHLNEDGSPRYTNRLILETSPYLLQHAHNPVNWYPWGEEAFETARRLGRPVLLSVGYSTCHWCHVMERESFEDVEIATYLNENYVAIKVDREERPDVDSIYMTAVQILTRRGGWPMTVWLTADRQPFYGATYIPARDGDRGVSRGFLSVLRVIRGSWDKQRDQIVGQAGRLSTMIATSLESGQGSSSGQLPDRDLLVTAAEQFRDGFDTEYGGLKRAPKFPSTLPIGLLLRAYAATDKREYLDMADLTLEKMASGGMFDQVGGGFHRYSTDARWLVPHFEKMLYDNALLVIDYLEGYQATGRQEFADTARRVLEYAAREMASPQGGFYSATDADSLNPAGHTEEGWFFTWTPEELEKTLGPEEAPVVAAFYGVSAEGNFEGRSILNRPHEARVVAAEAGVSENELEKILQVSRARMYAARKLRPPPLRDDKILTAWNGLMISAFAVGGQVLAEPRFVEIAERAADFLLRELREDGRLRRTWLGGVAKQDAFLDDYAFLIAGLLDLTQASSDPRWLDEAKALQEQLDRHYWDAERGGYYLTAIDHEAMLAREKPLTDGAEPSGNGVTLLNQYRLAELTTEDEYRSRADWMLQGISGELSNRAARMSESLVALDFRHGKPKEIVLVAPDSKEEAEPFLEVLRRSFLPNKVVVLTTAAELDRFAESVPFLAGKLPKNGQVTAYVCEAYLCKLPTTDVEVFEEQLKSRN